MGQQESQPENLNRSIHAALVVANPTIPDTLLIEGEKGNLLNQYCNNEQLNN